MRWARAGIAGFAIAALAACSSGHSGSQLKPAAPFYALASNSLTASNPTAFGFANLGQRSSPEGNQNAVAWLSMQSNNFCYGEVSSENPKGTITCTPAGSSKIDKPYLWVGIPGDSSVLAFGIVRSESVASVTLVESGGSYSAPTVPLPGPSATNRAYAIVLPSQGQPIGQDEISAVFGNNESGAVVTSIGDNRMATP